MRFCPFCSAENAEELAVCQACGRRLPPLPPRRARNAPGTGVQLPPRAVPSTQPPPLPRRSGSTNPPPIGGAAATAPSTVDAAGPRRDGDTPGAAVVSGTIGAAPRPGPGGSSFGAPSSALAAGGPAVPSGPRSGPAASATAPGLGPPARVAPTSDHHDSARGLASALFPGPAAQRREPPPAEPPDPSQAEIRSRRRSDPAPGAVGTPLRPVSSGGSGPRPGPSVSPSSVPADPPWATGPRPSAERSAEPRGAAGDAEISATRSRDEGVEPPPTRIHRAEALVDRPFTPPEVSPVPAVPEPGLINSARYTVRFAKARWQRRGAIRALGGDIRKDTDALDQVLGALGGVARTAKVDGRVFSGENTAITTAEGHAAQMKREHNDVDTRKLEENARFVDVERERNTKLGEAERMVDEVQKELAQLEGQRRSLRDARKELERRQKAYLKAAEDAERQAGGTEVGDARQDLRRSAEQHRREAAALEPERQEVERKLQGTERPIGEAAARLDAAKAELDAAKRSLADAREGHTHRLAELDAEQKRKAREIAQAEAEIARRLVNLGTLVNLNRVDDPQFQELYERIDRLRAAITARTTEIERLTAEREAYDRGNLIRGIATLGGAVLLFIVLIVILRAVLR